MNIQTIFKITRLLIASQSVFLLSSVSAETLTFASWQDSGVSHNDSVSQTATLTQDGVTFELLIQSVGGGVGNVSALNGAVGDRLGVRNGLDNGGIDSANTVADYEADGLDLTNDEALKFSLTVSGTTLTSLSLSSFQLLAFGTNEKLSFFDGANTFDYTWDSADNFNYTGGAGVVQMTGLSNSLNVGNVGGQGTGTWELTVFARDKLLGGAGTSTSFGVDSISFVYTAVPELTTFALFLGCASLCLTVCRRRAH